MLTLHRKPTDVGLQRKLHYIAKGLRRNATETERILWSYLRSKNQFGVRFRRQWPIDRYITDFVCLKCKLVIEIDGGIHQQQVERDKQRDTILELHGFHVLRFTNIQVHQNISTILKTINDYIVSLS